MRPPASPLGVYERLLAAGVVEPGVTRFGPQDIGGPGRCIAGRWVPLGTLGTNDFVLTGRTKGLEVIAEAPTWQDLDDALVPVLEAMQASVPTSRAPPALPPDPTVEAPPPPDPRDDIEDAIVVSDSKPVPPPEPSVEELRAIESEVVRTHGAEPIERS